MLLWYFKRRKKCTNNQLSKQRTHEPKSFSGHLKISGRNSGRASSAKTAQRQRSVHIFDASMFSRRLCRTLVKVRVDNDSKKYQIAAGVVVKAPFYRRQVIGETEAIVRIWTARKFPHKCPQTLPSVEPPPLVATLLEG